LILSIYQRIYWADWLSNNKYKQCSFLLTSLIIICTFSAFIANCAKLSGNGNEV